MNCMKVRVPVCVSDGRLFWNRLSKSVVRIGERCVSASADGVGSCWLLSEPVVRLLVVYQWGSVVVGFGCQNWLLESVVGIGC